MAATFRSAPRTSDPTATAPITPGPDAAVAPAVVPAGGPEDESGAVTGRVRTWLRAEGFAALAIASVLYAGTGRGWGLFAVLFLAPDLSFVAYTGGPCVGTAAYNALHSYVGPLALALLARATGQAALLPWAYVWAAHIGFDRLVGYGLKYPTGFGDTHLGRKGRAPRRVPAVV